MCVDMKYFPERFATPSRSSFWRSMMRYPFLQSRSWHIYNLTFQPSQNLGRSGGYRPYISNRESLNYCSPSSIPLSVYGCIVRQSPVFFTCHNQCATKSGVLVKVSYIAAPNCSTFLIRTYPRPLRRIKAWSIILNSSWTRSAATTWPVMTRYAVQFFRVVLVGSGRARPACFAGRRVNPAPGFPP